MITAKQSAQLQLLAELEALPISTLVDLEEDLQEHKRLLQKAQRVLPDAKELGQQKTGLELLRQLLISVTAGPKTGVISKLIDVSRDGKSKQK